jgi:hypothetical protein
VAVWDTLKPEIERVLEECPGALQSYPDPRSDRGREPPLSIGLAPWATVVARDLHDRFGDGVVLTVGARPFPEDRRTRVPVSELGPELDASRVEFALQSALEVRSGHTLRSELKVWNWTDDHLEVVTTGMVIAYVVDPGTGAVVGGFSGAHRLPRVVFQIAARACELIPLVVGTASFVPDLGFAVPPGAWAVRVPLELGDGRRGSSPALPITVTP